MLTFPNEIATRKSPGCLPLEDRDDLGDRIAYGLRSGYAWCVEHSDDPHPRSAGWRPYSAPISGLVDEAGVVALVDDCRRAHPDRHIRLLAFASTRGVETVAMTLRVNRP